MKGKKITGAAILLFAGLALALYFLKKDPLREVHALWEETMTPHRGSLCPDGHGKRLGDKRRSGRRKWGETRGYGIIHGCHKGMVRYG